MQFKSLLNRQINYLRSTTVILAAIPDRYNLPETNLYNRLIKLVNTEMCSIAHKTPNIELLDLHKL